MFVEESLWIKEKLSGIELSPVDEVLNIGSSDEEFLKTQPHITANVISPLREKGCRIVNLDIRPAKEGDYTGDITDRELPAKIARKFRLVVCTNLLEHVADRKTAFSNMLSLTSDGGYLLVTVPNNYPRHPDPIDTMYRPSSTELEAEIGQLRPVEVIASAVLEITDPRYYHYESKYPFWGYRKMIFWRRWASAWRWKVSCVLLKLRN